MNKIAVFVSSLLNGGTFVEGVIPFLDKEKRPGAQVVTESFIEFGEAENTLEVKGVLGAIKSERRPASFVAFSGVEISKDFLRVEPAGAHFGFDLSDVDGVATLSVQIVLKDENLFARDLKLEKQKKFKLPFSSFKESCRGRLGEKNFEASIEKIKSVRFFLKRSENLASSKAPLNFRFSLSNLSFTQ